MTSYSYRVRAGNQGAYSKVASATTANRGGAQKQMFYIEADHLNTPRMIASSTGTTVWRWDQTEPFGDSVPNADPDGDGIAFATPHFQCGSIRERSIELLPGQYFDRETNLNYNYSRDYSPGIGRYVQSDPMGLLIGLNTYAYVSSSPLMAIDLFGLASSRPNPCDLAKQAPNPDKDPCGCQKGVLVDLCKCYKDNPFDIFSSGRGVCVERAYLKKSKCVEDCVPKDACLGRGTAT